MNLDELRLQIDEADRRLLAALADRMDVARRIGEYKKLRGKAVFDPKREELKLASLRSQAADEIKPYIDEFYGTVFAISRDLQQRPLYGVLGQHLPHTYSPVIHNMLTDKYAYSVIEHEPDELDDLMRCGAYGGFNVTIPYKKEIARRCDFLDESAAACGSVNTVVFDENKGSCGYNTDIFGFSYMLRSADINPAGRKCLVLGHGGAAAAVEYALRTAGAESIRFTSRSGEINYDNVYDVCADAEIIINCTPVGMYPDADGRVVDLGRFKACTAFADLIYNPMRTRLIMQAQELGLKTAGGLTMLVAQAYQAYKLFIGDREGAFNITEQDERTIESVVAKLRGRMMNITLIGMPGCGKTTLARELTRLTGRELIDLDEEFARTYGISPAESILRDGEEAFREKESAIARRVLALGGRVVSTGGGIVTREKNFSPLRCNSMIIYVKRPLEVLASAGRPITARDGVAKIYEARRHSYEVLADVILDIEECPDKQTFLARAIDALRKAGLEL